MARPRYEDASMEQVDRVRSRVTGCFEGEVMVVVFSDGRGLFVDG
jgi:hypothetical protein